MSALLWRVIIAVIAVVILFAAIPLLFQIVGFPLEGPVWALLRICIAGIAVFYVLSGRPVGP